MTALHAQEVQDRLRKCKALEAEIRRWHPREAGSKSPTPTPPPVEEYTTLLQVPPRCLHAPSCTWLQRHLRLADLQVEWHVQQL